jgi:hypothetical protein
MHHGSTPAKTTAAKDFRGMDFMAIVLNKDVAAIA